MTARTIVICGLGILAMVLIGTMTIGQSLLFYVGLTLMAAVIAGLVLLHSHQNPGNSDVNS
jgi:uncharacterized membrane protein YccC